MKKIQSSVNLKVVEKKPPAPQKMRTAKQVHLHICATCKATFSTRANLVQHCHVHSGLRPYLCSVCFKAFAYQANLNCHIKNHTGEKKNLM